MVRFIAEQEKLHSYLVGLHVQPGNWIAEHTVGLLTGGVGGPIERRRGRHRPRGRSRCRQRSRAGLHAHLHRRVSPDCLGVGCDVDPDCDAQKISLEFPRSCGARRGPAAGRVRETSHDASSFDVRAAPLCRYRRGIRATTRAGGGPALTLREAVDLALARNHAVRLAQLSVEEKDRAKDVAKSGYFPQVRNDTTFVHLTDTQLVEIPAGGLGVVGVTPVPPQTHHSQSGWRECRHQRNRHRPTADTALQGESRERRRARRDGGRTRKGARPRRRDGAEGPSNLLPDFDHRRPAPRGARHRSRRRKRCSASESSRCDTAARSKPI